MRGVRIEFCDLRVSYRNLRHQDMVVVARRASCVIHDFIPDMESATLDSATHRQISAMWKVWQTIVAISAVWRLWLVD